MSALPESSSLQMSKMIEICSSTLWKKENSQNMVAGNYLNFLKISFKKILTVPLPWNPQMGLFPPPHPLNQPTCPSNCLV